MLQPPAPWTGSAEASAALPDPDPASDMDARPATPPRGRTTEAAERSGGEASPSGAFARVYGEASFRREGPAYKPLLILGSSLSEQDTARWRLIQAAKHSLDI